MYTWVVRMNRKGAPFEVEVMASSQNEARKKAKEQYPDANAVSTQKKK